MHTGLGTVNDHAVVALGLPKSADGSKPEGVVPSSHQAEGAAKAAEVVASFAQYAGVVSRSYPEKAVALWGYLATVMSCQNRATSGWWRSYDVSLRHSYSSMEQADFLLNQCLLTQAMVESSESLQCPGLWLLRGRGKGGYRPASHGMTAGLVRRCRAVSPTAVPGWGSC